MARASAVIIPVVDHGSHRISDMEILGLCVGIALFTLALCLVVSVAERGGNGHGR